ncbi:hypothetical protein [Janibacter cremeus]|uniref:Uncharacterized protein n=1 Tax=Janibacter cremeus TaxID=1285192 RepID=A0A852VR37_9MICO|nr:hypothetical protein [Janibacter cremeus]NYF97173.1 hypothetical protein [Janibacter cremeus]
MAPMNPGRGAIGLLLVAALALSGCAAAGSTDAATSSTSHSTSSASTSQGTTSSRTSPTSTSSTPTTSTARPVEATSTTTTSTASSTTPAAPVGPQRCGQVTTTIGDLVTVEIIAADVDCAFAVALLTRYYTDPPSPPQGSGGYVDIGEWNCNSSSSQAPGRASTCRTEAGGLIITHEPASAPTPQEPAGTPPPAQAPSDGHCALIDQPTLDQMFPDGVQDEQKCANYIAGEGAIYEEKHGTPGP